MILIPWELKKLKFKYHFIGVDNIEVISNGSYISLLYMCIETVLGTNHGRTLSEGNRDTNYFGEL